MSDEATFWRMEAERHAPGSCGRCRDPYCAGDHETADPFSGIPDLNSGYAGTVLETSAEREQRANAELTATAGKAE